MLSLFCLPMLALLLAGGTPASSMIGRAAPPWDVVDWLNSEPLTLKELRGKPVLVRWWTGPTCPYCKATAPALNRLHREYGEKGLVVIGFYHHKSTSPLKPNTVAAYAADLGFTFPLATDLGWRTLRSWWLSQNEKGWTSVTFLLDRRGIIRFIHPGGQFRPGDPHYAELQAKIEHLLKEPPPNR